MKRILWIRIRITDVGGGAPTWGGFCEKVIWGIVSMDGIDTWVISGIPP